MTPRPLGPAAAVGVAAAAALGAAQISPRSRLVGTTLRASQLRHERGLIIVAIKKASGQMAFNPPADATIEAGDILITLGSRQQLDELEQLASG